MSCYYPNFIIFHNCSSSEARRNRYDEKYQKSFRGGWKMMKEGNREYKFFKGYDYDNFRKYNDIDDGYEVTQVPCGNCIGCRLDYSRQWANRCYLESLGSKDSYFITLTYDDKNLPIGSNGNPTLLKDEISNFMKDLRSYYKYHFNLDNVRFFACGLTY